MGTTPKILALAGSLRRDSLNKKLAQVAAAAARAAGAEVTYLDLRDLPLPIYDGDIEAAGFPDNVRRLKSLMKEHQGLLVASPEYNSSVSGALKNAIDWASRAEPNEAPLTCFKGKVAGLMSASPGALGGLRGLVTLRSILGNIQVLVIPEQVTVTTANEAFSPDGRLIDPKQQASIDALAKRVVQLVRALEVPR
ncbi:MAG: NAD(P)H-dependent oxidoreductase [Planctomycetota bacterium]|nr:NAD(P)H-dependent oxidoreductase [Planctomycetota bacterium]